MPIIFKGSETIAYRDPTCIFVDNTYHLFFTISQKENGYMYNYVAHSESKDLIHFSTPILITEKDNTKNFCSPGNVIRADGEYLICVTSYPMPRRFSEMHYADETARLFFIKTKDFVTFSKPEKIHAKGIDCTDEGRMIDPYVLQVSEAPRRYLLFFKQNGVSISESNDLKHWTYLRHVDGGENACILQEGNQYHLIHSPQNGIGHKITEDFLTWTDLGVCLPKESQQDWANGRLTAAFAMKNENKDIPYQYLVFFHGSRKESIPETHGSASLALYYTHDFEEYFF